MLESIIFNYKIINKIIFYDHVSIIMLGCIDRQFINIKLLFF